MCSWTWRRTLIPSIVEDVREMVEGGAGWFILPSPPLCLPDSREGIVPLPSLLVFWDSQWWEHPSAQGFFCCKVFNPHLLVSVPHGCSTAPSLAESCPLLHTRNPNSHGLADPWQWSDPALGVCLCLEFERWFLAYPTEGFDFISLEIWSGELENKTTQCHSLVVSPWWEIPCPGVGIDAPKFSRPWWEVLGSHV